MSRFRTTGHQQRGLQALAALLPPGSVGVEIGSAFGESANIFMHSGKVATLTCIDPWQNNERITDADARYASFLAVEARWPGRLYHIRADSSIAAPRFRDSSLDFVYIDGAHDAAAFTLDLFAWIPKVRWGGILAGHDYRNAVEATVLEYLGTPDATFEDSSWLRRNGP